MLKFINKNARVFLLYIVGVNNYKSGTPLVDESEDVTVSFAYIQHIKRSVYVT